MGARQWLKCRSKPARQSQARARAKRNRSVCCREPRLLLGASRCRTFGYRGQRPRTHSHRARISVSRAGGSRPLRQSFVRRHIEGCLPSRVALCSYVFPMPCGASACPCLRPHINARWFHCVVPLRLVVALSPTTECGPKPGIGILDSFTWMNMYLLDGSRRPLPDSTWPGSTLQDGILPDGTWPDGPELHAAESRRRFKQA